MLRMVYIGPTSRKDIGARPVMTFPMKGEQAYTTECKKLAEAPAGPESIAAVRRLINERVHKVLPLVTNLSPFLQFIDCLRKSIERRKGCCKGT